MGATWCCRVLQPCPFADNSTPSRRDIKLQLFPFSAHRMLPILGVDGLILGKFSPERISVPIASTVIQVQS